MGDGSLSQEEIDALLMGGDEKETQMAKKKQPKTKKKKETLFESLDRISTPPLLPARAEQTLGETGALDKVSLTLTVILGETHIKLEDLQRMGEGSIVILNKLAGEEVEIRANNIPIALGEVVVVDEYFGVRVTERISLEKQKELLIQGSRKVSINYVEA